MGRKGTYHSSSPLIDNLDQPDLVLLFKLIICHCVLILLPLDLVCDSINHVEALLEFRRNDGL
jgi:hypothetical protein